MIDVILKSSCHSEERSICQTGLLMPGSSLFRWDDNDIKLPNVYPPADIKPPYELQHHFLPVAE